MDLVTFTIDRTVAFNFFLLTVIFLWIICCMWIWFKSGRTPPLDARKDSRELISHMANRLGWRTIAEAEAVEKQVIKKEITEYLQEVQRLIDIELG